MKPLRDFCKQWPLEYNQMVITSTSRSPKSFWPLVKILEKIYSVCPGLFVVI